MTTHKYIVASLLFISVLLSCKQKPTTIVRDDLKKQFDYFHVVGSFVLYEPQANQYTVVNVPQATQLFSPASTFKICHSLIGLETGVLKDEHFVIPWDSVVRDYEKWNTDHDLKTAFKNSTVWYYQELARRIGNTRMQYWLTKASYGNATISGGIDAFWLSGGLRISPMQQVDFLKRLHDNQLPFSQRSMNIVKKIMIAKDTVGYVVRAKTGWGKQDEHDIGWYVGYLESPDKVYYFATCIQANPVNTPTFLQARLDVTYRLLHELDVLHE